MDSHAFASLARVRILLVPVGNISRSSFDKHVAEIRSFNEMKLSEIPGDANGERVRFMPSPLSTGYLHISFPSHPPSTAQAPLSLLRPSHFPLAVLGIASFSQADALHGIANSFDHSIGDIFPPDSLFPLAKKCFVFEEGDQDIGLTPDIPPSLVVIPSVLGNKTVYIENLLGDLCSQILGEFGVLLTSLESPIGNEYLNSTVLPLLPPLSDMPRAIDLPNRRDSLPPLPRISIEINGKSSSGSRSAISRTGSPGTNPNRQSTLTVGAPNKKRLSTLGVASSHGRLFKVTADLYLLAGRTEDATIWYQEALTEFKYPQDAIWHASALEGIATLAILSAWQAGQGLQTSTSTGKEPWGDITSKIDQAISLYQRQPSLPNSDHDFPILTYLYVSAILRLASLHFAIWSAKGWGPLAFTTMLQPGPSPYLPPTISDVDGLSWTYLERMSSKSGVSRNLIASILSQAHGPWLLHLGAVERIAALETMAGIYSCIGYKRKEAYMLREVLGCILDLVVCGRDEDGVSRRHTTVGSPGGAFGLPSPGLGAVQKSNGNVGVRQNESTEGNDSVLRLLKYSCKVLGIDLDAVSLAEIDNEGRSVRQRGGPTTHDDEDLYPPLNPYGWPELQVGVVREAVAVAEALPDFPSVAQFALSALKTLHTVLLPADQRHLHATSARALVTARRRGDTKYVEYWSGKPLQAIRIEPLPVIRLPIEKPMSALQSFSTVAPILSGAPDPFLYNPRRALTAQGQTLVVQNELLEFVILLRNPFVFDLELQSLTLSTSGVPFQSKPLAVIIPANSLHTVTITGTAVEPGILTVRGCNVQAPGGACREYLVPMPSEEEETRMSRKRSAMECESGRFKLTGLDSERWAKDGKRYSAANAKLTTAPSYKFLECKVVQEQPLLRIRRTSLTHGAVMLYNGEMSILRITLENVSSLPIDFLRLSFDDSTIEPAQKALVEGGLSVFDTYEMEYELLRRPMFTWTGQKDFKTIAPGESVTVTVRCYGKAGCTNGTIHVSYSCIYRNPDKPPDVFHTRQLSYPVMVTVYHMLTCSDMDILPYPAAEPREYSNDDPFSSTSLSIVQPGDETNWCLFSIEVRNMYGLPFKVTFDRKQLDCPKLSTSCIIAPGSTTRIVLPLKRFLLQEEATSQPIPTLSDKQFVLTKSNLTAAEQKAQRELFWYREELFKYVRGRWKEAGGTRSGDLSLRQQRMTLPMLETMCTQPARVELSILLFGEGSKKIPVKTKGAKFVPPANEFLQLCIKVTNLALTTMVFSADLSMEPAEQVLSEGVLSDLPVGRLASGESGEVVLTICFLSYGRFDISANVLTLGGVTRAESRAGSGHIAVVVAES